MGLKTAQNQYQIPHEKDLVKPEEEETRPQTYYILIIEPIDIYTCMALGDAKIFAAKYLSQLTGYRQQCTQK